jgi:hypothetical protein
MLRSTYADLALYFFIRNSVPMSRFEPRAGFGANWCYYYDKPTDPAAAAAQGSVSSGVSATPADVATRTELREALLSAASLDQSSSPSEVSAPPLSPAPASTRAILERHAADEDRLLLLAAQQRSILEMFCALFSGAPRLPSLEAFAALGIAATEDQLQKLGCSAAVLDATRACRRRALVRTAAVFRLVLVADGSSSSRGDGAL